jgi:hypothetical protein
LLKRTVDGLKTTQQQLQAQLQQRDNLIQVRAVHLMPPFPVLQEHGLVLIDQEGGEQSVSLNDSGSSINASRSLPLALLSSHVWGNH